MQDADEAQERSVEINGVEINHRIDGSPDAAPLALINGARTNLHFFDPIVPTLCAQHRVVRHDWRGTGRSSPGPRADYNFVQYADDLAGLLDHLAIDRAVICGMAYGARTAARFALRHPDRVRLLALYDVSLDQPVDQTLQREGNDRARELRKAAGLPRVEIDRAWFAHTHEKECLRSLTAHVDQPDPTPELAGVAMPTLVACGRQDVNLPEAQRIAALMPDAELQIMEMTGHGSALSRPDLVAEILLEFIARRG
jgi:3-oxoadipate enol-lactonase